MTRNGWTLKSSTTSLRTIRLHAILSNFLPPSSKKLRGHIALGFCLSIRPFVTLWVCIITHKVYARILKLQTLFASDFFSFPADL